MEEWGGETRLRNFPRSNPHYSLGWPQIRSLCSLLPLCPSPCLPFSAFSAFHHYCSVLSPHLLPERHTNVTDLWQHWPAGRVLPMLPLVLQHHFSLSFQLAVVLALSSEWSPWDDRDLTSLRLFEAGAVVRPNFSGIKCQFFFFFLLQEHWLNCAVLKQEVYVKKLCKTIML